MFRALIYLIVFYCFSSFAQNASPDCINAMFIQSGTTVAITTTAGIGNIVDLTSTPSHSISNPSINPSGNNIGCLLSGETMPSWYLIQICNTGTLQLVIGSSNNQFAQGGYYDWAIWKYSGNTCSQIKNNQLAPLRCNWNYSATGGTGICDTLNLPSGGFKGNYELPLPVNAGDSLVFCINNYSAINYFIDFISIGSSSINCNVTTKIDEQKSNSFHSILYSETDHSLKIKSPADEILIFDLYGKSKFITNFSYETTIDCSELKNGIYIVALKKNNIIIERKKIIIH